MLVFSVMAAPLEYVRPELFDEAVDRHHQSATYVVGRPDVDADTPAVDFEVHNSYLLFISVSLQ
jgi:hypothetical protein